MTAILRYFGMLLLLLTNTVFIYQYKIKTLVQDHIDKKTELLKVKWLSFLFIGFSSPLIVFFFNQTPNYNILRFHYSLLVCSCLVIVSFTIFMYHTFIVPSKVDLNACVMKRRDPIFAIMILVFLSEFLINTRDVWLA